MPPKPRVKIELSEPTKKVLFAMLNEFDSKDFIGDAFSKDGDFSKQTILNMTNGSFKDARSAGNAAVYIITALGGDKEVGHKVSIPLLQVVSLIEGCRVLFLTQFLVMMGKAHYYQGDAYGVCSVMPEGTGRDLSVAA